MHTDADKAFAHFRCLRSKDGKTFVKFYKAASDFGQSGIVLLLKDHVEHFLYLDDEAKSSPGMGCLLLCYVINKNSNTHESDLIMVLM
jgi:hypothetical protein